MKTWQERAHVYQSRAPSRLPKVANGRSQIICGEGVAAFDRPLGHALVEPAHPLGSGPVRERVGVDTPGAKINRDEAIKQLIAARATVHIISYTEFVRQKSDAKSSTISAGQLPTSSDPITATDPTLPPGTTRQPSFGVGIRFDPAMKRLRKAYDAEVRKSQEALKTVANETGGQILLPLNRDEMVAEANEVARAIGAEYVVTYRPKRPLAEATPGEYRRIQVASRRVGLNLQARRGYVVPQVQN